MNQDDPLRIDVVSDVVCPWCFVGKRRLEKAVALGNWGAVIVNWRPFQLDPTIPPEGIDREDYLARKFGGPEQVEAIHARLREAGRAEGISFAFERIARSPNTLDAHRLIHWAHADDRQDAMVERLFALYFLEGADLGDRSVLIDAARTAGLDAGHVEERLPGDADRDTVAREIAAAQHAGIGGVPCFVIEGRYAVMGAQSPEIIAGAIERARGERQGATA